MRIAILLTSKDTSEFALQFPDDGEKFRALLSPHRPDWEFDVFPATDCVFPSDLSAYDGYVITGSPSSVNEKSNWVTDLLEVIRQLHKSRSPLFGCCFGHQAIAKALGGKVDKNEFGWSMGIVETKFSDQFNWMPHGNRSVRLYSAHSEQVTSLPEEANTVGVSHNCLAASFVVGEHMFTTQYHPELPKEFMTGLVRHMAEDLSDAQSENVLKQLENSDEGPRFGEWIVRFLEHSSKARKGK